MRKHLYVKSTIAKSLSIGLGLLVISFLFGISCQAPAPTPIPAPAPTPAPAPSPAPTATEMEISGFAFIPETITISVGTAVTWTNNDSPTHTVTTRDTLFDSGTLSGGATFSYTFAQSGTFEYYCKIHPYMTGKIIVE